MREARRSVCEARASAIRRAIDVRFLAALFTLAWSTVAAEGCGDGKSSTSPGGGGAGTSLGGAGAGGAGGGGAGAGGGAGGSGAVAGSGGVGGSGATGGSGGTGGSGAIGGSGGAGGSGAMGGSGDAGGSGAIGGSGGAGGSGGNAEGGDGGAASVGGVPGGKAGAGTAIGTCQIFPNDNAWNVRIDGPDVQVNHTYDSELQQSTPLHPDFGDYTTNHYGIPFNPVAAGQADETTVFSVSANQSDPGPGGWVGANPVTSDSDHGTTAYPFFVGMKIEGDPKPGGTPGSLKNDQHAIVLEQGASGCTSYEAWNCVVVSAPPFPCATGAIFDLTSNALRPAGWTSADAAGLSILAGLVRLAEVQAGAVNHAIRMTFNVTQEGYIPPATHAAGSMPFGSAYPPMGLRLRLKESVATSSYLPQSQAIMAAMKTYGLIVADNGSDWYFQGDSDDGWDVLAPDGQDTLIDEVSGDFENLTGADFEAVFTGDAVNTGL